MHNICNNCIHYENQSAEFYTEDQIHDEEFFTEGGCYANPPVPIIGLTENDPWWANPQVENHRRACRHYRAVVK